MLLDLTDREASLGKKKLCTTLAPSTCSYILWSHMCNTLFLLVQLLFATIALYGADALSARKVSTLPAPLIVLSCGSFCLAES